MGGERRIFHELQLDISTLTARQLQEALQEIASGTCSFGAHDEWRVWYHYLLGQLLSRSHESFGSSLLQSLVTGFMALYPQGVQYAPYPEFLQDALLTLGRCMMEPHCWAGSEIVVGSFLHRSNNNPNGVWCWWDASGDFSASLYFCLKYLPSSHVRSWFSSVLAIESAHWRSQVIAWLVGSHGMLCGQLQWPSEFKIDARPSVGWEWSHCLRPELGASGEAGAQVLASLLPATSRAQALEVAYAYFTEEVFLAWLESIASVPYLEAELAEIPSTFEELYLGRG